MTDIRQRFRDGAGIPASLVFLLAFAAGATVANIYYSQPLLNAIAGAFGTSVAATGVITVATQLGYATGLLLIVPLGDTFERRGLICTSILASAGVLLATAFSPTLPVLVALSYLLGLACVSPQLIVPYAATFAAPEKRGRVVGTVMGGLLVGILVSRSVSGVVGAHFGWQGMYFIGAVAMVLLATGLRWKLPPQPPHQPVRLRELLVSLWPILKGEPVLQRHLLIGAAGFGAFSVFWTTLSFYLAARPEHYGSEVTGLFGLIGVAGALVAPVSGRLSDRFSARVVNGVSLGMIVISFAMMALADRTLAWLVAGVFFMDAGAQGSQISNQSRIYALSPALRNRINAIYMVGYFIGGAIGSAAGSWALQHGGWAGVCFAGGGFGALGLAALFMPLGGGRREN
ncbi:MFS transporter [Geminisphaera colitermitum]|uniref:MFS transporter n=1 Tax=Geminisphaera colitermitum TaxID=1148786 RepID=UPI000158CD4F|nr:MFS transporter [Geminisphaera colitermitum]